MEIEVDEQGLLERLGTLTMEEAGIGNDEPDALVVQQFGQVWMRNAGDVDDVARLAPKVRPFGPDWQVDYRFCAPANDERIDSVAMLLRSESDPRQRLWLEVSLSQLAQFEGGSIDAALVFLAGAAVRESQPFE